jgi:single-strand DNA-binding protein
MMALFENYVYLKGNCGPELKSGTFGNGSGWLSCSIAVNDSWKNDKGEWQEETQWFNLNFIGKLAERAKERLGKGVYFQVEGAIKFQEKDGATYTNVRVDSFDVLERAAKSQTPVKP